MVYDRGVMCFGSDWYSFTRWHKPRRHGKAEGEPNFVLEDDRAWFNWWSCQLPWCIEKQTWKSWCRSCCPCGQPSADLQGCTGSSSDQCIKRLNCELWTLSRDCVHGTEHSYRFTLFWLTTVFRPKNASISRVLESAYSIKHTDTSTVIELMFCIGNFSFLFLNQ